jgi:outer membrane protein TolC
MKRPTPLLLLLALAAAAPARATERPLSLVDALNLARQRVTRLRQADIDVERAKIAVLQQILSRIDLKLTSSASALYQGASSLPPTNCPTAPDACRSGTANGNLTGLLTVPLWTGLTMESNLAGARFHEKSAHAAEQNTARQLILDVAQAYWEVRRRELELQVLSEQLRHYREFETLTQQKVTAGIVPAVDFNRSKEASLNLETQIISRYSQLEQARAQLASVLEIEEPIQLTDDPTRHTAILPALEDALHDALAARPELAQVEADYQQARMSHRAAKGAYYPQLNFVMQGQLTVANSPSGASTPSSGMPSTSAPASSSAAPAAGSNNGAMAAQPVGPVANGSFYMGLQMNWNIFDMAQTWTKVRDAGFARDRADADRTRRRHDVIADVRTAHALLSEALRAQEPLNKLVGLARNTLDLLRRRYSVGNAQLIDVLDAQDKLLTDELQMIDRAVDVTESDVKLQGAMGRF